MVNVTAIQILSESGVGPRPTYRYGLTRRDVSFNEAPSGSREKTLLLAMINSSVDTQTRKKR
jgi:hypothetical protein